MENNHGEELFNELCGILEKDKRINEVDHVDPEIFEMYKSEIPEEEVPEIGKKNRFLNIEHKLAISLEIIPDLMKYSLEIMRKYRTWIISYEKYDITEANTTLYVKKTCSSEKTVQFFYKNELISQSEEDEPILKIDLPRFLQIRNAVKIILLLNGENYTAINVLKELFFIRLTLLQNSGSPSSLETMKLIITEIEFISLVNLKFRRSSVSWHYRKLLFDLYFNSDLDQIHYSIDTSQQFAIQEENTCHSLAQYKQINKFIQNELFFITKAIIRQDDNYYAWLYRNFILKHLPFINEESQNQIIQLEFNILSYLRSTFYKTSSVYFYFSKIILLKINKTLGKDSSKLENISECKQFLQEELGKVGKMIALFGTNENLQRFNDFLVEKIKELV